MKLRKLLMTLPIVALALPALAQSTMIDVDEDGMYSYPEVQAAMPTMSMDDFTLMDTNGDGLLDAVEIAAGVQAGMLPASDG